MYSIHVAIVEVLKEIHVSSLSLVMTGYLMNYTEHQKKLITSSERHSLKSTCNNKTNIWSFGHRYANEAHLRNHRDAFVNKEKNAVKSQKVIFQKSQKLLAENIRERQPIQNIQ